MKTALYILSLVCLVALGACSKTCFCTSPVIAMNYVGYDAGETDTVILRRYDRNSNFNTLLDTAVITGQNAVFAYRQDTLSISTDTEALTLRSYFDFVLFLPSLNQSDSLHDITEIRDREKGSRNLECSCINRILSYQLNSDTLQVVDPALPQVFIKK